MTTPDTRTYYRESLLDVRPNSTATREVRIQARQALTVENYNASQVVKDNEEILKDLDKTPFRLIAQQLIKGQDLTFEDAFLGMTFVVAASNPLMFDELKPIFAKAHEMEAFTQQNLESPAKTFLSMMAQKELAKGLQPEEVAGMVAAGMMDLNTRIKVEPYVLETGGMGGDRGFLVAGEKRKVINASTLSAVVVSSLDVPVIKHGSSNNTSKVGSTNAIEDLGVNVTQSSLADIKRLFDATNFYFSDAIVAKNIHDLSHSPFMRYETVNHVIGPMTPPVDKDTLLHKVIGVNEGVHPSVIAKAYQILNEKGYQRVGNVAVVSGLSHDLKPDVDIYNHQEVREFMQLDEVSPYQTMLGLVKNGEYIGTFLVKPEDFGTFIDPELVVLPNEDIDIKAANHAAIQGKNDQHANYLALNSALALFVVEYLGRDDSIIDGKLNAMYLRECFSRCSEAITSGKAARQIEKVVNLSNLKEYGKNEITTGKDVDAVILDIDGTLVEAKNPEFYNQYKHAVHRAIAVHFGVTDERANEIANYYRGRFGHGELALMTGTIGEHFPDIGNFEPDYGAIYDELIKIDPSGEFERHAEIINLLELLKASGKQVVAITDSPEPLSRNILQQAGINPESFDLFLSYTRASGPRKLIEKETLFKYVAQTLKIEPGRIIAIGDTYDKDVLPAKNVGMRTCFIGNLPIGEEGESSTDIKSVLARLAS